MNNTFSSMPGAKTIGNYIISKNLGQGTFGKVKLGIHNLTQEKVAIKILQKNKISDVSDVERVTREINILKQVRHPSIIQLYQIIETPKQLFLVMEYVSEGELFDHIVKKKRLKQSQACEYFQQIVAGVEYLHEIGVVHRDLKPENVLIDFNKRVKLVDFGLSNCYKQRELLKTACGSPCYAAPEMIAGKKYQGLMADVWSCGVILYAMICGYLPFEDPNTSALYKKIISGQFSIPKFVSSSARDLIRGILTTDPQKRMSIKQIKEHEWFRQINNNQFYNFQRPPIGIKTSVHLIPVDENIVQEVRQFDPTNSQEIKNLIANNRHNHTVTNYYLLLKKNLKQKDYSTADICSPIFQKSLLLPKSQSLKDPGIPETPSHSRSLSRNGKNIQNKTIDEIDLSVNNRIGTSFGTRTANRVIIRDSNINKNNFVNKMREDSVELKFQQDNLPIVDNMTRLTERRRKFNIQKDKKQDLSNLYGVQQTFRATAYVNTKGSATTNRGRISSFKNAEKRAPISFRTSFDRYQVPHERYQSLDVSQNDPETYPQHKQKQSMNKTFMGRMSVTRNSIPKWSDESERIRSILNKTITGYGTRRKKSQLSNYV